MMDYARHFYPVPFIQHTLDAMAASKLNVLHMHITDDESFPMESSSVPALAQKGAFQDRNGNPLTYVPIRANGVRCSLRFSTQRS
jgi:N-acetyl-beta-hexosaminidase